MLERDIQAKCIGWWRGRGNSAIKNDPGVNDGFPDWTLFEWGGETCIVEFKQPGAPPRKKQVKQREWLWHLARMGHRVFIIDDFEEFKRLIPSRSETRRTRSVVGRISARRPPLSPAEP